MSCHFHLMRKRKAAMAKKAEHAPVMAPVEAPKESVKAEVKSTQKAAKGRRKGEA